MRRLYPLLLLLSLGCQPSGCTRPAGPSNPPERIVSLSPAATEILFAIGAGPKVVAGTDFDNFPEEAKALEKVGGFTPQSINLENVVAKRPDLVVAAPQTDIIAALKKQGVAVVALDAKTSAEVVADIERLGTLTGNEGKAAAVATDFRTRWAAVKARGDKVETKPRVLFVLDADHMISCGKGTFIDEVIAAAGGVNVFADTDDYPKVSDEQVLTRGVDVILCVDHVGGAGGGVPARLKARKGWDKLDAVKNDRVTVLNADLITRPGPRLVDGLEAVEKALRE